MEKSSDGEAPKPPDLGNQTPLESVSTPQVCKNSAPLFVEKLDELSSTTTTTSPEGSRDLGLASLGPMSIPTLGLEQLKETAPTSPPKLSSTPKTANLETFSEKAEKKVFPPENVTSETLGESFSEEKGVSVLEKPGATFDEKVENFNVSMDENSGPPKKNVSVDPSVSNSHGSPKNSRSPEPEVKDCWKDSQYELGLGSEDGPGEQIPPTVLNPDETPRWTENFLLFQRPPTGQQGEGLSQSSGQRIRIRVLYRRKTLNHPWFGFVP